MDGENNGKFLFLMDDLGGKPTIFGNIHIQLITRDLLRFGVFFVCFWGPLTPPTPRCLEVGWVGKYVYMGVSLNRGTQQPWVFLLKMIILGCFGGTTISGNTHLYTYNYRLILWRVIPSFKKPTLLGATNQPTNPSGRETHCDYQRPRCRLVERGVGRDEIGRFEIAKDPP